MKTESCPVTNIPAVACPHCLTEQVKQLTRELDEFMHALLEARRELNAAQQRVRELEDLKARLMAERERDEAVWWIGVASEELLNAGGSRGDRTVVLANLRALVRERDALRANRDALLARIETERTRVERWGRERDAARALLREIGINCGICMACGKVVPRDGHAPDCRLDAVLKAQPLKEQTS